MTSRTQRRFAARFGATCASSIIGMIAFSIGTAEAQHSSHTRHSKAASDTPVVAEYKAAHEQMMRAMDLPYTGDPDVDYRIHMIPHHAGAMEMSRIAIRHAKRPRTRPHAEAVLYEQQREISEMQGWLSRRGVTAPSSGQAYYTWPNDFVRTDVRQAPGTRDELAGQSWAPGIGVSQSR